MNLEDVILRGDRASQPAANTVGEGVLYYVTDELVTERSNGTTWDDYSDSGGGGGGGSSTSTGIVGSEPGTPTTGDLYLPSNGFSIERYDSGWIPWGPIFPFTAPIDGDFAWINQGGASVDTTNGGIYLSAPADASVNHRIRKKAAPSTPYTITAIFLANSLAVDYHTFGLLYRNSGAGTFVTFAIQRNIGSGLPLTIVSSKYNGPTSYNANYFQLGYDSGNFVFLRIADNGTNRISSYSSDGQHWTALHTVGRTDFLTADEVGFYIDVENGTYPLGVTLLSWKIA